MPDQWDETEILAVEDPAFDVAEQGAGVFRIYPEGFVVGFSSLPIVLLLIICSSQFAPSVRIIRVEFGSSLKDGSTSFLVTRFPSNHSQFSINIRRAVRLKGNEILCHRG